MAVQINKDLQPGQLYLHENGDVAELKSYCLMPTATVEHLDSGRVTGGGAGCLNLEPYTPVEECSHAELLQAVVRLSITVHRIRAERLEKAEALVDARERLLNMMASETERNTMPDSGAAEPSPLQRPVGRRT